jgi:hypothetical protein
MIVKLVEPFWNDNEIPQMPLLHPDLETNN